MSNPNRERLSNLPKITQLVKVSARAIHPCQVVRSDHSRPFLALVGVRVSEVPEQVLLADL